MAVKRYFSNDSTVGGFTLPSTSAYNVVGTAAASALSDTAGAGAGASGQATDTSATTPLLLLTRRFLLTDQMLSGGSFGGAWNMVVGVQESNAAADMYFRMVIRIFSADGTTERGSAYVYESASELTATMTGTAFSGTISTPWTVSTGDRILIEMGAVAYNNVTTTYQVSIRRGGTSGDMVAGDTGTNVNNRCGWITFTDSSADARFSAGTSLAPGVHFLSY